MVVKLCKQNTSGMVSAAAPRKGASQDPQASKSARCEFVTSVVTPVDEDMGALKSNPYFDKYAKKISDLQKTSPKELFAKLESFHKNKSKPKSSSASQNHIHNKPVFTKGKSLNDIMKVDLLTNKTPEEVTRIWLEHHGKTCEAVAAVMTKETYLVLLQKSEKYPTFLLPLPRDKGYEYIVCQFSGCEVHFTPLVNFKTFKENAPECLALTHFTELQDSKGIVLVFGEFNKDVLDVAEATCLANQLQRYYAEEDERRQRLLEQFTKTPMEFNHIDLIVELERLAV